MLKKGLAVVLFGILLSHNNLSFVPTNSTLALVSPAKIGANITSNDQDSLRCIAFSPYVDDLDPNSQKKKNTLHLPSLINCWIL